MSAVDILVIGAGLAGLTLAKQLATHGTKVTLIDKSTAPGGPAFHAPQRVRKL